MREYVMYATEVDHNYWVNVTHSFLLCIGDTYACCDISFVT